MTARSSFLKAAESQVTGDPGWARKEKGNISKFLLVQMSSLLDVPGLVTVFPMTCGAKLAMGKRFNDAVTYIQSLIGSR